MPSFKQHCDASRSLFGEEFQDVHLWLDAFFRAYGPKHRQFRHHKEGIEEVRAKWGDRAAEAAELHITMDLFNLPIPSKSDYIGGDG
jgi:DNA-binding GntR family transcriptional regulator